MLPLARLVGNGFPVHRAVSALAVVAACALQWRLLRAHGADGLMTAVGVLLFYASSLYFVAPLARPDSLGVCLSLASLVVLAGGPATSDRGVASGVRFAVGLVIALLGLATKPYFVFPPFVYAAWVALRGPRWRGLAYGGVASGAVLVTLGLLVLRYPAYVSLTLVANAQTAYRDGAHLLRQSCDWALFSLPLTIGTGWLVAIARRGVGGATRAQGAGGGCRSRWSPDFWTCASLMNSAVFAAWLGWTPGAHMTYAFHLVTPVLLVAVLPRLSSRPQPRTSPTGAPSVRSDVSAPSWGATLVAASLPVALLTSAPYVPHGFGAFRQSEAVFAQLAAAIDAHPSVIGSSDVAGLLALRGRAVVDSGQSEYVGDAMGRRPLPGTVPAAALLAQDAQAMDAVEQGVAGRQYDLIIRNRRYGWLPNDLAAWGYTRRASVDVTFAWTGQAWPVDLWEPRR